MEQKQEIPDLPFNVKISDNKDDILASQSSDHEYKHHSPQQTAEKSTHSLKENLSIYDLSKAGHPLTCIFTILFKIIAILSYYFLGAFFDCSNTFVFITVSTACAVDFWLLKNISGRLLVGLRWWSDFKEDGSEVWIFESYDGDMRLNKVDSAFFWTPQIACAFFWGLLFLYHLLTLNLYWGILNGLALLLISVNLMAYHRCNKEHEKKMKELENYVKKQGLNFISKNLISQALNNYIKK